MTRWTNCGAIILLCVLVNFLTSCDEQTVSKNSDMQKVEIDSSRTEIVNVSGKLFSIPSPIQTAMLIKKTKTAYNRESLSKLETANQFATNNLRALNLGIYGTDMAYASLYNDGQTALKYFKAVNNLATSLEINGAINTSLVKRLGNNVGNADSLLLLSGKFYRAADEYLKENERYDIAGLVLAGGWVESSYLTVLAAKGGNTAARERLAAQKESIETICEVLNELGDKEFIEGSIKSKLDSLNMEFKNIEYSYTYQKPETNSEKKTTLIKSTSTYEMSDEQLASIAARIEEIRLLINSKP